MEPLIGAALFGAVVPSFVALNLLMSNMEKDEKIRLLEVQISCTDKILGVIKKKEF